MESKIDLHIIKSDRPYFDECIKSVEDSNAPINLHIVITGKWFEKLKPSRGFTQQVQMHHIVVYRRSVIEPLMHYLEGVKCREKNYLT